MKLNLFLFLFILFSGLLCSAAAEDAKPDTSTGDLSLRITGFENNKGTVKIALVNSKESYDSNENIFRGARVTITDKKAAHRFENIPAGEYAVKVFHDVNNNDDLDRNFMGVPKEAYGFSNNVRGKFGPPGYDETKFIFNTDTLTLDIVVK